MKGLIEVAVYDSALDPAHAVRAGSAFATWSNNNAILNLGTVRRHGHEWFPAGTERITVLFFEDPLSTFQFFSTPFGGGHRQPHFLTNRVRKAKSDLLIV